MLLRVYLQKTFLKFQSIHAMKHLETSGNIKIVQLFLKKIYASNLLFQNNKGILLDKCNNDKDFIRI